MSTIVEHSFDHRGMKSSTCPRCDTLFAYWDAEDLDDEGNLRCYCDGVDENHDQRSTCCHCGRTIWKVADEGWVDPDATGDDSIWREGCDGNVDSFEMRHEPEYA